MKFHFIKGIYKIIYTKRYMKSLISELLSLHKEIHNREPIYCEYCPVVLHGRVEYLHHMRVAHQQYQGNTSNVQYVGQPMNEDRVSEFRNCFRLKFNSRTWEALRASQSLLDVT